MPASNLYQKIGILLIGLAVGSQVENVFQKTKEKFFQKSYNSSCYFGNQENSNDSLFKLNGKVYRIGEFSEEIQTEYQKFQFENYSKISNFSERLAARISLTKNIEQLDISKLPNLSESLPELVPTEAELQDIFNRWTKSGLIPANSTFESHKARISNSISGANTQTALNSEIIKLRQANNVTNLAEAPCPFETVLPHADMGFSESNNQRNKVVYTLDYSCFTCRTDFSEFQATAEKLKNQSQFAVLPISTSVEKPVAELLARVTYCSQKNSGDVWKIFQASEKLGPQLIDSKSKLDESHKIKLISILNESGLDSAELLKCAQLETTQSAIMSFKEITLGTNENIRPLIFVNGRTLPLRPGIKIQSVLNEILILE